MKHVKRIIKAIASYPKTYDRWVHTQVENKIAKFGRAKNPINRYLENTLLKQKKRK